MEDEDLFFEDDVVEEAPAARSAGTATKSSAKSSPKRPAAKPASTAKAAVQEVDAPAANTINLTVAVLLMVITFLVGFVGGTVLERGRGGGAQAGTVQAPPLTQQQIQQGQLPPGHVPIDQGTPGGGAGAGAGAGAGGGTTPKSGGNK